MVSCVKWAWLAIAVAGVLAFLYVGLSIAGEMDRKNCIAAVEARYPVAYQQPLQGVRNYDPYLGDPGFQPGKWVFASGDNREQELAECGGWP